MITNVGIGFVAGRKQFQTVLNVYINNWLEHGLLSDKNVRIHLLIASAAENEDPKSYKDIGREQHGNIYSVTIIDKNYARRQIDRTHLFRKT